MYQFLIVCNTIPPPFRFEGFGFEIDLDGLFWTFLLISVVDYLLGISIAWHNKNIKFDTARKGLYKKFANLIILVLADILSDVVINDNGTIREAVAITLITQEVFSLGEHFNMMGVQFPPPIQKALSHLSNYKEHNKITSDKKSKEEESDEQTENKK